MSIIRIANYTDDYTDYTGFIQMTTELKIAK